MTTEPAPPEIPPDEELRARLLEECEIPALLATALDAVPDAWSVLWVQRELSRLGDPALLRDLESSRHDPVPRPKHDHIQARRAEELLRFLRDLGFAFDFERGRLKLPPRGGRRRSLYRALVGALDEELRRQRPRPTPAQKLERMAAVLTPFFDPKLTSTGSRSLLARTLGNV